MFEKPNQEVEIELVKSFTKNKFAMNAFKRRLPGLMDFISTENVLKN